MALAILVAVDDDPYVLEEVETQLVQRYGRDYRVECLRAPDEALRTLTELRDAAADVALVLAGQSFSGTTCGELFEQVRQLHPHAKRALLVEANAWTYEPTAQAIRSSLALGRIDHYVLRPAAPQDEVFHEAVSDFLLEWALERCRVPQTVHIVGEAWSGRAYELREVFARCVVPHAFYLADSDEGREFVARAGPAAKLPLMVLPNGDVLSDPSNAEIAEAAGAPRALQEQTFEVVIVGSGPAGLSAAVYGASEGLRVLVVDAGGIGGQARSSPLIRNYLGFGKGVSGSPCRGGPRAGSIVRSELPVYASGNGAQSLGRGAPCVTLGWAPHRRECRDPRHRSKLPASRNSLAGGAERRWRFLRWTQL
jgi:thioredoxin reductase (NADPH)